MVVVGATILSCNVGVSCAVKRSRVGDYEFPIRFGVGADNEQQEVSEFPCIYT